MDPCGGALVTGDAPPTGPAVVVERLTRTFGSVTALSQLSVEMPHGVVGLLYALLWETVLGGYMPGVRGVSVRQWALAAAERILGDRAFAD